MFEKIESFGAKRGNLSCDRNNKLIEKLKILMNIKSLPNEYNEFLLFFGSSITFECNLVFKGIEASPWASDNLHDVLESLYGLNESVEECAIFEAIESYKDEFKSQWLPIGSSSGGNQIFMCICGEMYGQIWFWDHEADPKFDAENVISGMTLCATSFTDFINRLEVDNEEPDVSGVVKVDLDF